MNLFVTQSRVSDRWPVPNTSFISLGEVIPTINEGYSFDDVDGREMQDKRKRQISGRIGNCQYRGKVVKYAGGQIAMKTVRQAGVRLLHGAPCYHTHVTFTINVTYNTTSGSVTEDVISSGTLISAVQSDDGAVIDPVQWQVNVHHDRFCRVRLPFHLQPPH